MVQSIVQQHSGHKYKWVSACLCYSVANEKPPNIKETLMSHPIKHRYKKIINSYFLFFFSCTLKVCVSFYVFVHYIFSLSCLDYFFLCFEFRQCKFAFFFGGGVVSSSLTLMISTLVCLWLCVFVSCLTISECVYTEAIHGFNELCSA